MYHPPGNVILSSTYGQTRLPTNYDLVALYNISHRVVKPYHTVKVDNMTAILTSKGEVVTCHHGKPL